MHCTAFNIIYHINRSSGRLWIVLNHLGGHQTSRYAKLTFSTLLTAGGNTLIEFGSFNNFPTLGFRRTFDINHDYENKTAIMLQLV